jgi:hypothetical protein
MLTRRQIFGGGTQSDILMRQITVTPPPVRTYAPDVPAALEAAVMAALSKDRMARPQTAFAFAERVSRAIGRELAWPAAFRTTTARPTPVALRTASGQPLVLRRERPPVWRLLAGGAAAATLLTGAVVAAKRRAVPPPAAAPVVAAAPAPAAAPAAPRPATRVTVLLQSVPPGAQIVDARQGRLGVTPFELVVPAGEARSVMFQKEGFRPLERAFEAVTDTTIAVRLDAVERAARTKGRVGARIASSSTTIDPFGSSGPRKRPRRP